MTPSKPVKATPATPKKTHSKNRKPLAEPAQVSIYRTLGGSAADPMAEREFLITVGWPLPDAEEIEPYLSNCWKVRGTFSAARFCYPD